MTLTITVTASQTTTFSIYINPEGFSDDVSLLKTPFVMAKMGHSHWLMSVCRFSSAFINRSWRESFSSPPSYLMQVGSNSHTTDSCPILSARGLNYNLLDVTGFIWCSRRPICSHRSKTMICDAICSNKRYTLGIYHFSIVNCSCSRYESGICCYVA